MAQAPATAPPQSRGRQIADTGKDAELFKDIEELQNIVDKTKRSRIHNIATMKWLRSRCRGKREVPKSYLMYPEQMNEELQIRRVFNVIDADGSDALDLEEMVEMFNRYNISLDRDKLQKIYDIVDETRDGALNYREFKACALSPNANEIFSQIMNELHAKEQREISDPSQRSVYLPRTFQSMITYLSYLINREKKIDTIMGKIDENQNEEEEEEAEQKEEEGGDEEGNKGKDKKSAPTEQKKKGPQKLLVNLDNITKRATVFKELLGMRDLEQQPDNPYTKGGGAQTRKKVNELDEKYQAALRETTGNLLAQFNQEEDDDDYYSSVYGTTEDKLASLRETRMELNAQLKKARHKGEKDAKKLYSRLEQSRTAPGALFFQTGELDGDGDTSRPKNLKFKRLEPLPEETSRSAQNLPKLMSVTALQLSAIGGSQDQQDFKGMRPKNIKKSSSAANLYNQSLFLSSQKKLDSSYQPSLPSLHEELRGEEPSMRRMAKIMRENIKQLSKKQLLPIRLKSQDLATKDTRTKALFRSSSQELVNSQQEAAAKKQREKQAVGALKEHIAQKLDQLDVVHALEASKNRLRKQAKKERGANIIRPISEMQLLHRQDVQGMGQSGKSLQLVPDRGRVVLKPLQAQQRDPSSNEISQQQKI